MVSHRVELGPAQCSSFPATGKSKRQFQPELNLPGRGNRAGYASRRTSNRPVRIECHTVWQTEVSAIEEVEELCPEIQFHAFIDSRRFVQSQVNLGEAGANNRVPADIAI